MNIYKLLFCAVILFSISCNKDLCEDVNCLNNSTCNTESGECDCINGFTGDFCETAPDLCENVDCLNDGTCNTVTGECECINGYTGEFCETAPDLCENVDCLNDGTCNSATGECDCINGYTGEFCETAPDLCENVDCLNDGTCNSATGECECINGYTGEFCEIAPTPPTAAFQYLIAGQTVVFTNLSVNATDYIWDFGDGSNTTMENPSYTYSQSGIYQVSLTASNEFLSDTFIIDITIY